MNKVNTRKIAYISLMLAVALIISIVESFIPPIIPALPMIKLGLSNVVILFTYIVFGGKTATLVLILRCLLVSIFTGNFFSLAFSLPAGIISLMVGIMLIRTRKNSLIMVSATSAIFHNIIQIFVASMITNSASVFVYFPYLFVIGGISGMLTGFITMLIIKKMPQSMFQKLNG